MDKTEFLDILLAPIAALTELRWIAWPILFLITIWLIFRHFMHLQIAFRFSIVIWWIAVGVALLSIICVALLYLLSSRGPDFYRVAIGFMAAIPLVIPGMICFFIRPH